jgi:hypothetical protein
MSTKIKHGLFIISIIGMTLLAACGTATPVPITSTVDAEFMLTLGQTATIENTNLVIRLIGITNDQRCPSKIECAISGPVSLSIAIQRSIDTSVEFDLQTFTSNDGRAPDGAFEGIEDRIEYQGNLIQVKSVLPYPVKAFDEIKASEYHVIFIVSKAE